jgi:cell division septum initiation protein DivIVA
MIVDWSVIFPGSSKLHQNFQIPFSGRRIVKQRNGLPGRLLQCGAIGLLLMAGNSFAVAQEAKTPVAPQNDAMATAVQELQQQVRELRDAVAEMRSEASQYRAETAELRRELESSRNPQAPVVAVAPAEDQSQPAPAAAAAEASTSTPAPSLEQRIASLEDAAELINSKVDDQYQTKIESASKYRVRLSGMVLMNLFSNRGTVDNADFPSYAPGPTALSSDGSFGATLRQSELGLEVFGPQVAGAKTSGEVQVDFAGGIPNTLDGVNYGVVRLRTASMRMDWDHTSIVAGQDALFFSPLSPTSFASLAIPAFGYSGNLWGWIPQVRIEHRFDISDKQKITIQGGILDNLVGEPPYTAFLRQPQAGESSAQPAYAARFAWSRSIHGQPLTLGTAAYYSRQNWGFEHYTDGWAGMADWEIPLAQRFSFTGEFYRGRAIGGLGGGIGQTVIFSGSPLDPATQVRGLNTIGGWSQLKFRATTKLEFNGGFGLDNPYASDALAFPAGESYYAVPLLKNRSALVNFVYRPRSDLLFSAEYLRLRTSQIYNDNNSAEQFNLVMGVLF